MESFMCEVGLVLEEISFMLKHVAKYAKKQVVKTPLAQFASKSYKNPSPRGVVLTPPSLGRLPQAHPEALWLPAGDDSPHW